MLRRRIHGNQLKRLIALCNKLMLRPRWNNNDIARFDFLVLASNGREALPRCEKQNLIDSVDLNSISDQFPNLVTRPLAVRDMI
jgi:hypothetical protein